MELKNYVLNSIDLVDCIIDEVALEGLDGITLEALWQRLAIRLCESLPLANSLMEQIWAICVTVKGFSFFELKKAREKLVIFDRFELINDDEPRKAKAPKDIYPHFPIDDIRHGIRGSSSSYNTRKDITENARNFSLQYIMTEYDQKFIIVASQSLRERALIGDTACPVLEMNVLQYCFLERVGRARFHGDVTHGKTGLSTLADDPKSMFYHRKFLLKQKLVTKQAYSERVSGNSYSSSLLHLTRFYVERRPKFVLLSECIINYLKSKENYTASYDEIKEKLQLKVPLRKIFKTPVLKHIIRTDKLLCGNMQAKPPDWEKKGYTVGEKLVKAIQLVDPNVDISQFWGKHDIPEEEESYDLDIRKQKLNSPFLKQANHLVEESQQGGLSQTELGAKIGMTKLHTRTMLRNLVKTKIIATYMNDVGKQRVTKYISKKFEYSSEMSKQLEQEMDKMKELNRTVQEENNESLPPNVTLEVPHGVNEEVEVTNELQNTEVRKDENLFLAVNKIFSKYRSLRSRSRYRYTSLNLSQLHATTFWDPSQTRLNAVENSDVQEGNVPCDVNAIKDIKIKLTCSKPQSLVKTKTQITGFLETLKNSDQKKVTYRLLKRANMIIEAIKVTKVIDDAAKLLKLIKAEEDKEGYDVKIDKKSLARLLQRLAKDNLVRFIKLTLSDGDRQKSITFICDPSIDKSHSLILSAVEQAKIKFCLLRTPSLKVSKRGPSSKKQKEINSSSELVLDTRIGRKYGYCPKFLRMKVIHTLLFYLVYEHPGCSTISKEEQIQNLRNEGVSIDAELAAEMSEVYYNEVDWKMFIPPLPKHSGWANGWMLICDVLIRLPLSIFTKIYNIPYVIPELEVYLDHPIKKHFLVKDISPYLRNLLLKSRKYIVNIHETITRLCYLGLIQFGPQKLKEKDQAFIYLNRRSQLMDTTSSSVGYHKIEDKSYPITKYEFKSLFDVEKYWYDMWEICIDTCLGGRLAVQGKDILLEDLSKKGEMIKAAKPRSPDEVFLNETGEIPGDHQGAAGIDSAFFAHLKRNWTWGTNNYTYQHYKSDTNQEKKPEDLENAILEDAIQKSSQESLKENPKEVKSKKVALKGKLKSKNAPSKNKQAKESSIKQAPKIGPKHKFYIRRVLPRKQAVRNRVKYDEVDYRALQRMDKLRVDWEPHEDNILLMCKVAMMYLFPNPRKQFVTFIAVRDTLRSFSDCSQNKTSRACQRRLLYMLKQQQTIGSVMLGIEEIKQNYFVNKRFSGIVDRIKSECHNPVEYEERVTKIFKELVAYISKKYYNISNMEPRDPIVMPSTVNAFNLVYELKYPSKTLRPRGFTKDVENIKDIHAAMINTVIHSSMCCGKDRRTWAYQLFKIYQQYSESLLRSAMYKIRADQMVAIRKSCTSSVQKYGNCIPMSNAQYQLSLSYFYKFQTKWPYSVFSESYSLLLKLIQWHYANQIAEDNYTVPPEVKGTEVAPITGGIVAGIHDFFAKEQIDFNVDMPDQIIMLDPRLQEKDEVYVKIAKRYQSLLMNYAFATESSGPRAEENRIQQEMYEEDEREEVSREEVRVKKISQRGETQEEVNQEERSNMVVMNEGTSANNYSIENANTVFFQAPQVSWNQNERTRCVEVERVGVRTFDKCFDSEDEDLEPPEKRAKLTVEDESVGPVLKRPRLETEVEVEEDNEGTNSNGGEKTRTIRTSRQYYAYNLKKMQTLLKNVKEPSQSLQQAVALQQVHVEADINSSTQNVDENVRVHEVEGDLLAEDPLRVEHEPKTVANDSTQLNPPVASDPNDPKYTRLGMLRMREDFNEISVADSNHAHDFFVVNSFNIFYTLKLPEIEGPRKLGVHQGYEVPSEIIPLQLEDANKLISKVKENAIFPKKGISFEEFQLSLGEDSNLDWQLISDVYNFIKERKDLGASLSELTEMFQEYGKNLCVALSILTKHRQVLRSGVTVIRYIHEQFTAPWLIHSCKIPRLEQEAQPPMPKGAAYVLEKTNNQQKSSKQSNQQSPKQSVSETTDKSTETLEKELDTDLSKENNSETSNEFNQVNHSDDYIPEDSNPTRRNLRKKNTLFKQMNALQVEGLFNVNSSEEINVVIKPWIRVDGALNRRVLDRMMGAVLSYCIKHPGVTLSKVQSRFVPALQPFHTRELVEMLVELGCLNIKVLKLPRVTLFSTPVKLEFAGIPELAQEDELVIESEIGATLRFGTYLSNKTYSSDFLS